MPDAVPAALPFRRAGGRYPWTAQTNREWNERNGPGERDRALTVTAQVSQGTIKLRAIKWCTIIYSAPFNGAPL